MGAQDRGLPTSFVIPEPDCGVGRPRGEHLAVGANCNRRHGAGVAGYVGFAIGRTIWWDDVNAFREGSLGRDDAREVPAQR